MKYHLILAVAAFGSLAYGDDSHDHAGHESGHNTLHQRTVSCGPGGSSCPTGRDTMKVPRITNMNVPYGSYIKNCTQPGMIALTFDDGPYIYTSQVLDTLKANNIKATFFILGNVFERRIDNPTKPWMSIVKRTYNEGHQIGSHTWSHMDLSSLNQTTRQEQMVYNEMAFRNIFGWFPRYMRPPMGSCSPGSGCLDQMTTLGYHVVLWNIETADWIFNNFDQIYKSKENFDRALAAGSPSTDSFICLCHDTQEPTQKVLLPYIIQQAKAKGYRFVTLGECLGDPESNWYVDARSSI